MGHSWTRQQQMKAVNMMHIKWSCLVASCHEDGRWESSGTQCFSLKLTTASLKQTLLFLPSRPCSLYIYLKKLSPKQATDILTTTWKSRCPIHLNIPFVRVWIRNHMHQNIRGNFEKNKFPVIILDLPNLKLRKWCPATCI